MFFFDYLLNNRHYGLCCLTAITFTSQDNVLANKLIKIYFAVFRVNSKEKILFKKICLHFILVTQC